MAKIISYVFHPLLMPTYTVMVLMWMAPPVLRPIGENLYFNVLLIVTVTSFFLPVLMLSVLKATRLIPDFYLEDRKSRIAPFLFVLVIYGVSAYMFFNQFNFAKIFYVAYSATLLLILWLVLINFFWKISIHSASVAGVFGIIYAVQLKFPEVDLLGAMAVVLLMAGVVGSSRLALQQHTYPQVLAGLALGVINCGVITFLFL